MGYFISEVWGFAMLGDFGVWRCVLWHSISAGGTAYPLNSMSWTSCSKATQIYIKMQSPSQKSGAKFREGDPPPRLPPSTCTARRVDQDSSCKVFKLCFLDASQGDVWLLLVRNGFRGNRLRRTCSQLYLVVKLEMRHASNSVCF